MMLLISILIHAMMQQATTVVAEGIDCGDVSCSRDCGTYLRQVTRADETLFRLGQVTWDENPHASEFAGGVVMNSFRLRTCCRTKCRGHCVTADNRVVPDRTEWPSADDPCTTHICNEGNVANHTSMCSSLHCPQIHHLWRAGECCPICDANWAMFCAEDSDCDAVCPPGRTFAVDPKRGCDLCKCAPATATEAMTTSLPVAIATDDAPPHSIRFYFYLDPTDAATKTLLIGISVAFCVVLVACLAAVAFYFHRRVYNKVPLLNFGSAPA